MEEKTSKVRTGTVNCMIAALIICLIAEAIGPLEFQVIPHILHPQIRQYHSHIFFRLKNLHFHLI